MAALPYMQLYVADYLADTMHLNVDQHGAYLLLIMNYWQTGKPLPDNDQRLQCVCRTSAEHWQELRPALEEFFVIKDGYWFHNRLDKDLEKVKSKSESARKAAEKRHKPAPDEQTPCERSANAERSDIPTASHTDTDTDTDTEKDKQPCETEAAPDISAEVLDYLNSKANRNFRNAPTNTKLILARAKEGATVEDFKAVIDRKCKEWAGNPGMAQYLRPATLFNAEKFNQYIGQLGAPMPTSNLLDGTSRFSSRHNGFNERDYSEGLIEGVSDDAANF